MVVCVFVCVCVCVCVCLTDPKSPTKPINLVSLPTRQSPGGGGSTGAQSSKPLTSSDAPANKPGPSGPTSTGAQGGSNGSDSKAEAGPSKAATKGKESMLPHS